ncbi:ATP-binding response regulator [Variovorax saccharolyticus]|uniref:ATP-binding response regulator n=1 Tax=Variovorax saccharolyticus TaxID=3053516 RepID=UPI0025770596|nr:hybrid sensor histidine kinase/response regulator [Variovorax sp. J31P216]MDM0029885.1 ATP-binding protein [Variovorax sp. J31P216]
MQTENPVGEGTAEDDNARVIALELESVMSKGYAFFPVYSGVAFTLAWVMEPGVHWSVLLLWSGAYVAYVAARALATEEYQRSVRTPDPTQVARWCDFVKVSSFTQGLLIGSTAQVALPNLGRPQQIGITCLVIVVCVVAAIYAAPVPRALTMFVSLSLVPYVAAWLWIERGGAMHMYLIPLGAMFLVLYIAWPHHLALRKSFRLIVANSKLADQLNQNHVHLKKNYLQLQALEQSTSHRFAVASHDLRQPIHALGFAVAEMDERDDPAVLREGFAKLRESTSLVSEMLMELMDMSQLERAVYIPDTRDVELESIFEQIRQSQSSAIAGRRGISLAVDAANGVRVHSDMNLLRRILLNLVSNSIKYTLKGHVRVSWKCERGHVIVSVRDTGIGIPSHRLQDVFLDYVRLEEIPQEGAGLGLAIVRRAATLLDHPITVRSEVGVGSIFEISLPVALRPSDASQRKGVGSSEYSMLPGPTAIVLVIEDHPYSLETMCGILRRWGYVAHGGSDGATALASLGDASEPHLIISDMHLLDQTGLAAIRQVRTRFQRDIPALLLTGDVSPAVEADAEAQRVTVAHKPFAPGLMARRIHAMLAESICL